ncbi:hypothetical protein KKC94_04215 [Patescibacteria group bacterium]|nr:hypothetical protein [Patescibacteria group bacterium]
MKNKKFLIGLVVVLMAVAVGGAYYFSQTENLQGNLRQTIQQVAADNDVAFTLGRTPTTTFSPGQQGVELLKLNIAADQDVTMRRLYFSINASGSGLVNSGGGSGTGSVNFSNLRMVDLSTGSVIMGPVNYIPIVNDSSWTYNFTNTIQLTAGQVLRTAFLMDVENEPTLTNTPTTVYAKILTPGTSDFSYTGSGYVSTGMIYPGVDLVGPTLTAQ